MVEADKRMVAIRLDPLVGDASQANVVEMSRRDMLALLDENGITSPAVAVVFMRDYEMEWEEGQGYEG